MQEFGSKREERGKQEDIGKRIKKIHSVHESDKFDKLSCKFVMINQIGKGASMGFFGVFKDH